ncbi:MAG: methyltransferase domain-containing protein [Nannocystaceae bacterium]|nr:methyltransferase domain-containing protein [Nannocystaceae bacterium]
MTQWSTAPEQWRAWITEDAITGAPVTQLDAWDAEVIALLGTLPFGASHGVESLPLQRATLPPSDSMPTMVRPAPEGVDGGDEDDDAAKTLVHGARVFDDEPALPPAPPLEVSLQSSAGALQIELEPVPQQGADGWYIPPLTDSARAAKVAEPRPDATVIAPPPPPPAGATMPAPVPAAATMPAPVPAAATMPAPVPPAGATMPAPVPPPPEFGAVPSEFEARADAAIRTGTTLIPTEAPDAAASQTAGVIIASREPEPQVEPPPPRRASKIVIADPGGTQIAVAPSSGAVALDAAESLEAEIDPEVLESSDLMEAYEPAPPPRHSSSTRNEMPPPPPPAREPDGTAAEEAAPDAARAEPPRAEPPPAPRPAPSRPADAGATTGRTLPPTSEPHWVESVFAEHYGALARPHADRIAQAEAAFAMEIAGLVAGSTAIDVGCGDGRHAGALSDAGVRMVGLDVSAAQLRAAADSVGPSLPNMRWVHGDVRDRVVTDTFDAVLCLGTTVGYYDEPQNRRVIEGLRDLCRVGGRVVIHVINRDYAVPRLPARTWWQGQGCVVLDEVDFLDRTSRINVRRTIVFEDARQFEHGYAVRAYSLHELVGSCEAVGLAVVEVSGSRHTRGRFFGATSPDIWLVCERR